VAKVKARVKPGCDYREETGDKKQPCKLAKAGEVVTVSEAELRSFPDKLEAVKEA
jgi:hypothetical protein